MFVQPSPADDFYGSRDVLETNQRAARIPVATFYVEADTGTSMVELRFFPGDTLLADRFLTACHGDVVMACREAGLHGEGAAPARGPIRAPFGQSRQRPYRRAERRGAGRVRRGDLILPKTTEALIQGRCKALEQAQTAGAPALADSM